MRLLRHISLLPYNTFGIDLPAEALLEVDDINLLQQVSETPGYRGRIRVLGGGSNILLTRPVSGLLLHNRLKGIRVLKEDEHRVWLEVQSGEVWHELVLFAIAHGWAGIENLALIPGSVGAAPMQNIGAYGVEVKEVIESVAFWHWEEKEFMTLDNEACRFGYRDSIFKQELRDKVFISSVVFRLNRQPSFRTEYGAILQELEKMNITELSVKAIADAVIAIRTSKLPDPGKIGNAGSFFKNPAVSPDKFSDLRAAYPDMPFYPVNEELVKIPAGWMIEHCGWKGYRKGDAGVHDRQALVLVNHGHATGREIWDLSERILESVAEKFGIALEREVNVW